jgi:hypothetical protein
MYSIIPLAGPDFYNERYGIKPLFKIDGEFLIKKILNSRKWVKDLESTSKDFIFIVKSSQYLEEFKNFLKKEFLDCKIVEISSFTKGALMSSLAGLSMIEDFNKPIAFDLIDIDFKVAKDFSITNEFLKDPKLGAILPYFKSDNMQYSYVDINSDGYIKEAKEKKGWNFNNQKTPFGNASAGVYFFRNLPTFLSGLKDSIINYDKYNHLGNLFLCPAVNGVIKRGNLALAFEALKVNSISLLLKNEQ